MVEQVLARVQEVCVLLIGVLALVYLVRRIIPGALLLGLAVLLLVSLLASPGDLSRILSFVVPRLAPFLVLLVMLFGLRVMLFGWKGRKKGGTG